MLNVHRFVFCCAISGLGCSSAEFTVGQGEQDDTGMRVDTAASPDTDTRIPDVSVPDTLVADSFVPDTLVADTFVRDTFVGDTFVPDTSVPDVTADVSTCGVLGSAAIDVYVDKLSSRASVGTAECPFKTIREATTLGSVSVGTRVIHVAGASSAVTYEEIAPLLVGDRVLLKGEGAVRPKISGAAATCLGGSGLVCVSIGAIVEGFTISATSGNAVQTASSSLAGAHATLRYAYVTAPYGQGIQVSGAMVLGPGLQANGSGKNGVLANGSGLISVVGTGNTFDGNAVSGLNFASALASLDFQGGSASNNGQSGIALLGYSPITAPFPISNLVAKGNQTGLVVNDSTSVVLRSSVLIANKAFGMRVFLGFTTGPSTPKNALDIGVTSAGNNVFNTGDNSLRNVAAGVCFSNTLGTGSLSANGNKWSTCPPAESAVAGCDGVVGSSYSDIWYVKNPTYGAADPISVSGCGVGP
ncbi:MAG: hypothetical protein HYV09_38465 [Deltaproteobacteria bacterium]|nr:hypothetical protein [Deltaproteobacteria bacterium]